MVQLRIDNCKGQAPVKIPQDQTREKKYGTPTSTTFKGRSSHFFFLALTASSVALCASIITLCLILLGSAWCIFAPDVSVRRYISPHLQINHEQDIFSPHIELMKFEDCGVDCWINKELEESVKKLDKLIKQEEPEIKETKIIDIKFDDFNTHPRLQNNVQDPVCEDVPLSERFDCMPQDGTADDCAARGCCWETLKEVPPRERPYPGRQVHPKPVDSGAPLNVPYCYYPHNYQGYFFTNFTETDYGLVGYMQRNKPASPYHQDVLILRMDVYFETETRIRVRITDPLNSRWESPLPVVPLMKTRTQKSRLHYKFKVLENMGAFKILRKRSEVPIFDTISAAPLQYADQFIELSSRLPSDYIYGLGEHLDGLLLDTYWTKRVMWNLDQIPEPGKNLYGSHPFYLSMEPDGSAHGVFLLNSNAMEVILQPTPAVTFRTTGGIIDLFVFLGPTPNEVISQYTEIIGRPFLPPYWSLGYHQCRYQYGSLNETRKVWQRTRNAGIPFDTQWNDLDYMSTAKDFTYDHEKFSGLPEFVKELHEVGMHYIPIIDPGISAAEHKDTYLPWDEGIKLGVFVRNISDQPFIGKVWNPVATVWPDFTHRYATYYWTKQIGRYHAEVPIDGAWIDMNEPSNFWSGESNGCPDTNLDNPPYLPAVHGGVLYYHTICMSAKHFLGYHYNIHNLYGFTETISTNLALSIVRNKRPFVISRSTFPGQGHFGGHWTGDVMSDWFNLWQSIPGILNFNMFGIPMVGADICGFNGNTTASLCLRWMQLGAFYPFSRNHNTDDGIDQDPVALGEDVVIASRNALNIRYILLPYLYSLFFNAHLTGEPVARPLFFQFHKDPKTYAIDTQFMWGGGLMIVPVLKEDTYIVDAYIPHGRWYDWDTGAPIDGDGSYHVLAAPLDKIPLLIRGGYILPIQSNASTTTASRKQEMGLLVALSETGRASGKLYWDDGDTLDTVLNSNYNHIQFNCGANMLYSNVTLSNYGTKMELDYLFILGVDDPVGEVRLSGEKVNFQYNKDTLELSVLNLNQDFLQGFTVEWR